MQRDTKRRPEAERARQNLSIDNELKIKRVYQTEPIDPTSWAYMRALRQFGATKRIYPEDPYVEVYRLQDRVYGLLTENADGMGDPWMYLIDGPVRAMLIDTGFGIGDLKALCARLTGGKELVVVNTHGHPDHAGGNAQFDRVYCHQYEVPALKAQDGHMWDYLFEDGDRQRGRTIWSEFDREDIIPFRPYDVVGCPDGHTFDLGDGHLVELVHLGGHSAGSCALLDRSLGALFTGDDLLSMRVGVGAARPGAPYGEYMTVDTMRRGFERLSRRRAEFQHVYPGHFVTDLENVTVDAMLSACQAICADPEGAATWREGPRLFRAVEGLGTVAYSVENATGPEKP